MTSRVRAAAVIGGVAQAVFVLAWIIAASWQGASYSVLAHSISDMYAVTAPGAPFLVVVFSVCGAATILFLWASVWPVLRESGWPATVGVILLTGSIFGLGDLLTAFERLACRLADPGCTASSQLANSGGMLDTALSTVGVALLIAGTVFVAVATTRLSNWKGAFPPLLALAIATFVFFVADGLLGAAGLGGLFERLLALSGAATFGWLAIRILRKPSNTAD